MKDVEGLRAEGEAIVSNYRALLGYWPSPVPMREVLRVQFRFIVWTLRTVRWLWTE